MRAAPTVIIAASVEAAVDHTSITLESGKPIAYKMMALKNPDRLVLDMQNIKLDVAISTLSSKLDPDDACIRQVRSSNFKPGIVRVVFDLKGEVKPALQSLTPTVDHQYRLVLDVYPMHALPTASPEQSTEQLSEQPQKQDAGSASDAEPEPHTGRLAAVPPSSSDRRVSNGSQNRILDATLPVTHVLQQVPTLEHFEFCQGGGCAEVDSVGVSDDEWMQVRNAFEPAAKKAEDEREQIKFAIGLLERVVGPKTGTDGDRGGTFGNSSYPGQLDCNDESTNTTTYLKLMLKDGLLRFHHPIDTKTRGFFLNGWPHTTAAIQDDSGNKFAVDSWFFDNGVPPVIIPLEQWRSGWKPADW